MSSTLRKKSIGVESGIYPEGMAVFTAKVRSESKLVSGVILQTGRSAPLLNFTVAEARDLAVALLMVAAQAEADNE